MHHHIGGIEYIVPVGNMLYVDKIDDTAVDEAVEDIAGAATDNEAEANVFKFLDRLSQPEITDNSDKQTNADSAK